MRWFVAIAVMGCNGDKDPMTTGETGSTTTDPTPSTGVERVQTILGLVGDAVEGQDTFARICASCHGLAGEGSLSGPALTERVPLLTDEGIVTTILEGKGNMDAYDVFTNQEIADVLAHVTASFR